MVPFPFSTISGEKPRPALVLASWPCQQTTDYLLCMISSQNVNEPYILELLDTDVENGYLHTKSYIRPGYPFTMAEYRIRKKVGNLSKKKFIEVTDKILEMLCS